MLDFSSMQRRAFTTGFTLLEMAIILIILGSMAGGLLVLSTKKIEQNKFDVTIERIESINTVIKKYAEKGFILPCPASPTASLNSEEFGKSDDCRNSTPALADIMVVNSGQNEEVWVGAPPTRELNLPDITMFDGWGNRLRYAVIKKLALTPKEYSTYVSTVTTGGIQVLDGFANQVLPESDTNSISYILISYGKDAKGAQKRTGISSDTSCPAASTTKSEENCDDDAVFRDAPYNDGDIASEYFDDIVRFVPLSFIRPKSEETTEVCNMPSVGVQRTAAAYWYTCLINSSSELYCWGRNHVGQIGDGTAGTECYPAASSSCQIPEKITTASDWFTVDADITHSCGIRGSGSLYCWGENGNGQLGRGNTADSTIPALIDGQAHNINDWAQVSVDGGATCAIRTNGDAYCWGHNNSGEVGDGTTTQRNWPTQVEGTHWSWIATSSDHACGVRCGHAYCWGSGLNGRLGNGSSSDSYSPVEVSGNYSDWEQISSDSGLTCGIREGGRVFCWGDGSRGGRGDGTAVDSDVPVEISGGLSGFTYIDTGSFGACAVNITGKLFCWGDNEFGQLGNNDAPNHSNIPVEVPGDWVTVSVVANHVCGIQTNGKGYCWGRNRNFENGDGTNVMRESPQEITAAPLGF